MSLRINPLQLLELSNSADAEDFERRLVIAAQELGFPIISGAVITGEQFTPGVSIEAFGNTPEAYMAIAKDREDSRRDPVMTHIRGSNKPIVYTQATYVDAGQADLWETQAVYGYANGIAAKLHLGRDRVMIIGVDSGDDLPRDQREVMGLVAGLQLIATNAAASADAIFAGKPEPASLPKLSGKELEIMRWTFGGKTTSEIAQIMSISEHTVRFHIRNVTNRLGLSSKVHAAMKLSLAGLYG